LTAAELMWRGFGSRSPEGKTGSQYQFEPAAGRCCTCGAEIAEGVPFAPRRGVAGIDNDTFSGHGEFARWGTHACRACAWFYGDPKRTHRGCLVVGDRGWWPTIAQEIEGRPRWRHVLGEIGRAGGDAPMTGVLTSDPKPRLWPRAQLATCGAPGLYLHVPDYDVSGWTIFDLRRVERAIAAVDDAIAAGATKRAAFYGLWLQAQLVDRLGLAATAALEAALAPHRGSVELTIAVLIA